MEGFMILSGYAKKSFTLIELLVVISIIALFSSVVLAGVSTLRARAQEATIKANLKSLKSQAEIVFNNVGNYSTASSAVDPMIKGINKSGGTATFYSSYPWDHYAVSAIHNSDPTKNWSVSDTGGAVVVWDSTDLSQDQMVCRGPLAIRHVLIPEEDYPPFKNSRLYGILL